MADAKTRINGNEYSWASITLKLDGDVWSGFTEISYGHSRTRSKTYGMGRAYAPRGRTSGKYEVDAVSLKGPLATWKEIRKKLAEKSESGKSYGDVEMQITIQYLEGDDDITDELVDCVIVKEAVSLSESPDGIIEEVELDAMRLIKDGLTLYNE